MTTTTFVLLHGSWGGGWVWDDVRALMEAPGLALYTPTLSVYGDDRVAPPAPDEAIDHETHAREVLATVRQHDLRDIVLVGHSYGALVAAVVAARVPGRIRCLVVLDGFLPRQGRSIFDMHPEVQGLMASFIDRSRPWQATPPPADALGLPSGPAARRHDRQARPMPLATHANPAMQDFAALATLPRHYLRCTQFPVFEATAEVASTQGWQCSDIDSGHMPMVTAPSQLATRLRAIPSR